MGGRQYWNGVDERAFVPTADMRAALDVLSGTPAGAAESPSPFSVGVYTVDRGAPADVAVPMSMYYVSKAVADNRSQNEPPMERCVGIGDCAPPCGARAERRALPAREASGRGWLT